MKTTIRQTAAGTIITMLLIVGSVSAKATELRTAVLNINETSLQLENWMTDEIIWDSNSFKTADLPLESKTEREMRLKNWMTSNNAWNLNQQIVLVAEPELELENWMTSNSLWNINQEIILDAEPELEVEDWMTNEAMWSDLPETEEEEALQLENWMMDENVWK